MSEGKQTPLGVSIWWVFAKSPECAEHRDGVPTPATSLSPGPGGLLHSDLEGNWTVLGFPKCSDVHHQETGLKQNTPITRFLKTATRITSPPATARERDPHSKWVEQVTSPPSAATLPKHTWPHAHIHFHQHGNRTVVTWTSAWCHFWCFLFSS